MTTAAAMDWASRGVCRQATDPDRWFSDEPADIRRAIRACRQCLVRTWCDQWAEAHGEQHGVWGGRDRGVAQREKAAREEQRIQALREEREGVAS